MHEPRVFSGLATLCLLLLIPLMASGADAPVKSEPTIQWRAWGDAAFAEAQSSGKPLYLYLEAVWCHWCHVMQQKTLADEAVVRKLNRQFVPVRADHDAMPALANRYRPWGWPAQIWFSPSGGERLKRAGYIASADFKAVLDDILQNPSAAAEGGSPQSGQDAGQAATGELSASLRRKLQKKHLQAHDPEHGGLALQQKFLDPDSVELDMLLASQGDSAARKRARQTLDAALALIDPVWGGAYQYSTHGVWSRPHYEKIMRTQAAFLRVYALAYAQFENPAYRQAGQDIRRYLDEFLRTDDGAFFASQDADLEPGKKAHDYFALDDAGRRARGLPRVDRHRYAQHNGWAIEGLAAFYGYSGDARSLTLARAAAAWVKNNLRRDGGLLHAVGDSEYYLADNLAMARAWLELHRVTGEREYLAPAVQTADFIIEHFTSPEGGYGGTRASVGPLEPARDIDENIAATRFFNLLAHYSGEQKFHEAAAHGMQHLVRPDVASKRIDESGILLADRETASAPVHATVVGDKSAERAAQLFRVCLRIPGWYKRVEWWDRDEGPLPHADVAYPGFDQAAGYFCEASRCSSPQFDAESFAGLIKARLSKDNES